MGDKNLILINLDSPPLMKIGCCQCCPGIRESESVPMGTHRVISSVHANLKETGQGQSVIRMASHEISKLRLSMGDWFFFDASSAPHGASAGSTQAVVPRRQWLDRRRQGADSPKSSICRHPDLSRLL
jgi:hypothetical protein